MRRRQLVDMRVFHSLAIVLVVLSTLVIGGQWFGASIETPYLRYGNSPFPAAGPVKAGEAVQLVVERCNDSDRTRGYLVSHQLQNLDTGMVTILPDALVMIEPGCTHAISRLNTIPNGTAPGRYRVNGRATVHGFFAQHEIAWASQPFDVLEGDKP
jgi:hypothetical protein